jgi:hypothetical protein
LAHIPKWQDFDLVPCYGLRSLLVAAIIFFTPKKRFLKIKLTFAPVLQGAFWESVLRGNWFDGGFAGREQNRKIGIDAG